MRYSGGAASAGQELTAAEIVNSWSKDDLRRIIAEYGEERFASDIAGAIVTARRKARLETTLPLVEVIRSAVPKDYEQGRINPATRTFQALRIAVNDELGSITTTLPRAFDVLAPGGVLITISFHSLEDRLCKRFMSDRQKAGTMETLTSRPVTPTGRETETNPRSRSAKLRAAKKL
jgi:16S rRNA (cytosine1402-N4)-methyltransferase